MHQFGNRNTKARAFASAPMLQGDQLDESIQATQQAALEPGGRGLPLARARPASKPNSVSISAVAASNPEDRRIPDLPGRFYGRLRPLLEFESIFHWK